VLGACYAVGDGSFAGNTFYVCSVVEIGVIALGASDSVIDGGLGASLAVRNGTGNAVAI
jgi:hypothetical protein